MMTKGDLREILGIYFGIFFDLIDLRQLIIQS